jgi:hypothetical protein
MIKIEIESGYYYLTVGFDECHHVDLMLAFDKLINSNGKPRPLIIDVSSQLKEYDTAGLIHLFQHLNMHRKCFVGESVAILSDWQVTRYQTGIWQMSRHSKNHGRIFMGQHHEMYVRKYCTELTEEIRVRCSKCKFRFMGGFKNSCRDCKDGCKFEPYDWNGLAII